MHTLADFLNHGALPFTGRGGEMERLLAFWRSTPDANGLRALLLVGEAGIGKSRLIEELIPRIHAGGGLVVHTRILPESAASIVPLIAHALWYSEAGRQLLKKEPEENLGSVLAGLRRLSRLRPTLLVIEDIHLLREGVLGELWGLLDGLADETLSLLCDARPLDLEARGLLERYLVEEIELEGLGGTALEGLWREVFAAPADPSLLAMLEDATAGNPMAVRSALRGALASGAITRGGSGSKILSDDRDAGGPVRFDRARFAQGLKRDVGLLTEGMAAHLTPREKEIAGRLALLGEAFARETAERMLDGDREAIDLLIFRGILGVSPTPGRPLVGTSAELPDFPATSSPLLAFSHTLVHRYFADRTPPDLPALLGIVGADMPLYSLLPLQLLAAARGDEVVEHDLLRRAVARLRFVALELSTSPDWGGAMGIWEIAATLAERFDRTWTREERGEIETGLIMVKLSILANEGIGEEYQTLAHRVLELTANPGSTQEASRRIAALGKYHALDLDAPDLSRTLWRQAEELVERFPDLRFTHSYGLFLALVASSAIETRDGATARLAEARLDEMAADERGRQIGAHMRGWILPSCITVFESDAELAGRLDLLDELEHTIEGSQQELMLRMGKLLLLDSIGHIDRLVRSVEQSLPRFRAYNWSGSYLKAQMSRARALAALGQDAAETEAFAARLAAECGETTRPMARAIVGAYLAEAALLAGDGAWARALDERFPEGRELMENLAVVLLAIERGSLPDELPRRIGEGDRAAHDMRALLDTAHAVAGGAAPDAEATIALIRRMLARPLLRMGDILALHAVLGLLDGIDRGGHALTGRLRQDIHDALLRALEWLAERRIPAYMPPVIERAGDLLATRELKAWRARAAAIARERRAELAAARGDGRIRISMLGTISVEHPGGETQRVQGARLRAVLGLMAANQMMERSLSGREFCAIATGEEVPERARNVVYVKLHALREMLGEGAVVTETDQAPRLDTARVQVDLLDAHGLLAEARSAMREGALLRAFPALLKALELARGEVPFPGLYEEFFEAAREDFENELRSTAITVMRGLLREDDLQSAEEIARRTFEALPDDEEIGEILREALTRRGKRAEAERIRLRAAEALA